MNLLERELHPLTQPIEGQYPRPWMTDMADPAAALVFIIGQNPAKRIPQRPGLDHAAYLDGLFNRNGASCRAMYEEAVRESGASRTRQNIDRLTADLAKAGVTAVLQTNIICLSPPAGNDRRKPADRAGGANGTQIFATILAIIRPPILIAYGAGTAWGLSRLLGCPLPSPPADQNAGLSHQRVETRLPGAPYAPDVFVIPSLAPRVWNGWHKWAGPHLAQTCLRVRQCLEDRGAVGPQP